METEILGATQVGTELTELVMPFAAALVALVVTLMFKDYATKIAKGIAFTLNKDFQEGDKVVLDGERALIVKIGLTQTVFGITKSTGEFAEDYCWRYVPNERIALLKLEKIIFDRQPEMNGAKADINHDMIMSNKSLIEQILKEYAEKDNK